MANSTLRSAYIKHDRVTSDPVGPSRAKQSFAEECDINTIMAKYKKSGLINHVNKHQGNYGELPNSGDYQDSLNAIIMAKESFASLPAAIRNRFANNALEFLKFVENPDNRPEMINLGLTKRTPDDPPDDPETPPATSVPDTPVEPPADSPPEV